MSRFTACKCNDSEKWCVCDNGIADLALGLFDEPGARERAKEKNDSELEYTFNPALKIIEDWIKANQDRTESTFVKGEGYIEYVASDGRAIQKRNRGEEFFVLSAGKPYEIGQFATVNKNGEVCIRNDLGQVAGIE